MKRVLVFIFILIGYIGKCQEQTICGPNSWDSINNITILDQRLQPVAVMIGNVGRSFLFICDSNAYNNGLSYITLHYFQTHSGAAAIDSATKNMYYNISSSTGQQYAGALYQSGTTIENTGNMWLLGNSGTAFIKLGQPSTTTGIVIYYNSSNNNTLGLEGNYTKEPYVLTLPINAPSPGQVMSDSANGYLAWQTAYALPTNIGASKFLGTQKTGTSQTPTYTSLYAASLATIIDTTFRHSGFANNQVLYANGTNSATSSPNLIYGDGKWFYDVVTNTSTIRGFVQAEYQTGTSSARISGIKYRGTLISPTTVVTGDNILSLAGFAYDGTDTTEVASIVAQATGTISTGIVPGQWSFSTHNASGTSVQALLITSTQRLLPANSIYAKYLAIADSVISHTSFTTNGTLYASNANNIVSSNVGTSGYVWTSGGTSGTPTWQAASGSISGSGTQYYTAVWSGTSALTSVSTGTSGQSLLSNGSGAYPTYQTLYHGIDSVKVGTGAGSSCIINGNSAKIEETDSTSSASTAFTVAFSNTTSMEWIYWTYYKTTASNSVITFPSNCSISSSGNYFSISSNAVTLKSTSSGKYMIQIHFTGTSCMVYIAQDVP